jgi:hypothetical protein
MNGTFIIAFGAVWSELRFCAGQNVATCWTARYGTYAPRESGRVLSARDREILPWSIGLWSNGTATLCIGII